MKWTPEQIAYLREHYANRKNSELAQNLGCSTHAVANKGFSLKLKKSREFIKATSCQFKKGMIPHNKGKKLSDATKAKLAKTMFKSGNRPHNALPVCAESEDKDGYLMVKIAEPNVWRYKHHIAFGEPVPKGHKVIFIDGNKRNFELSNLRVVSNAEMMKMNTMLRFPLELQNTLRAIKKLQRTIENA